MVAIAGHLVRLSIEHRPERRPELSIGFRSGSIAQIKGDFGHRRCPDLNGNRLSTGNRRLWT